MIEDIHNDILSRFSDSFPATLRIGEGWLDLIYGLHNKLVYISPEYKIHQIKQKFGSLRYYAVYVPQEGESNPELMKSIFDDLISMAESNSNLLCETCGKWGERVSKGYYIFVGCNDHKLAPSEYC